MLEGQKYLSWAIFICLALVERTYYIKSTQIYLIYFQIQSTISYANVD